MRVLTLCFAALLPVILHAQEFTLEGPNEAKPGDLVILDASAIPSSGRDWRAINAAGESFEIVDDGQRLVFATARQGVYWFVFSYTTDVNDLIKELAELQQRMTVHLTTENMDAEEVKKAAELVSDITKRLVEAKVTPLAIVHQVTIGSGIPDDDVEPNPDPVIPDGRFQLAMLSRTKALQLSSRSGIGAIAGIYREIANMITRGDLKSSSGRFGEAITKATGQLLSSRLTKSQATIWQPWGIAVSSRITKLQQAGDISTDGDLVTAYEEIALGLSSIKEDTKPEPNPDPEPVDDVAWVILVEETADRTPEIAKIVGDLNWWKSLEQDGIKWRHYDDDSADAEDYRDALRGTDLPAILLLDEDGDVVDSFELPDSIDGIEARIKR